MTMQRPPRFVLPLLLLCSVAAAGSSTQGPLRPISITSFLEYGVGGGARFLRADAKGRLYLLRAKSLTVVRVAAGAPVPKSEVKLKARTPIGIVLDAAVCSGGDDWVILVATPEPAVRLFANGEEVPIPQPEWEMTGVACPGGTPAVAVTPGQSIGGPPGPPPTEPPALMLRWDGERWAPHVDRLLDLRGKATGAKFVFKSVGASQVVTTPDYRGRLWIGQAGFYNVRRVTSAGRVDTMLESGPLEVKLREPSEAERKNAEAALQGMGVTPPAASPGPRTDRALLGLAEGSDGSLYIFVAPRLAQGKLAIDRYSPGEARVMRIPVEGEVTEQLASFVADASGIYWAERSGKAWWLPSEVLEKAPWKPATQVRVH